MAAVRLMLYLTKDLPDISKDVYSRLKGQHLSFICIIQLLFLQRV